MLPQGERRTSVDNDESENLDKNDHAGASSSVVGTTASKRAHLTEVIGLRLEVAELQERIRELEDLPTDGPPAAH